MGYVPPALRNNPTHKPKSLSLKKLKPVIDYRNLKSKTQIFDEYMNQNYGKADAAWNEPSHHDELK